MLTTTVGLLAALAAPAGFTQSDSAPTGAAAIQLVAADSAHTLFTPNAPMAGRAGQLYQLPQGGFGVTTGGTSHYQTLEMPGASGVVVPNGGTSAVISSGGRIGSVNTPD